jgi:SAM-dependent MidA family methyltransferase
VQGRAADAIRAAIRDHGPISFSEFMEGALYGPGGYFEGTPVGARGDFVTSPHVHPIFGELLGRAVRAMHEALGRPTPFHLTEVGAGDGTLARQLLDALADLTPAYVGVEIGSAARASLEAIDGIGVRTELDGPADVVIANELLDNMPFRIVRDGREVRIAAEEDRFVETLAEPDDDVTAAAGGPGEHVIPVGAHAFVDRLASTLTRGYALAIDYGGIGTTGGPVHGYHDHRVVEDVLHAPGSTDITSGVDFGSLASYAERRGLTAFPSVTQQAALMALGFEGWFRSELERQQDLLQARVGLEAVRTWSGRSRATILIDPAALGRLRWLVLATSGLPSPGWLSAAQ